MKPVVWIIQKWALKYYIASFIWENFNSDFYIVIMYQNNVFVFKILPFIKNKLRLIISVVIINYLLYSVSIGSEC